MSAATVRLVIGVCCIERVAAKEGPGCDTTNEDRGEVDDPATASTSGILVSRLVSGAEEVCCICGDGEMNWKCVAVEEGPGGTGGDNIGAWSFASEGEMWKRLDLGEVEGLTLGSLGRLELDDVRSGRYESGLGDDDRWPFGLARREGYPAECGR